MGNIRNRFGRFFKHRNSIYMSIKFGRFFNLLLIGDISNRFGKFFENYRNGMYEQ